MAESGYPGYQAASWFGLVAPAGTPPAIVEKLNREVNAILNRADIRSRMAAIGAAPGGGSAEHFRRFIEQETDQWARLIASRGLCE